MSVRKKNENNILDILEIWEEKEIKKVSMEKKKNAGIE